MSEIPGLGDEIDDIPKPSAESVATTRRPARARCGPSA